MKKIISLVLVLSFVYSSKSQVFGTLNVPSTYTSIASVITAMNQQGVFGNVVVAIAAGYTETAPLGGYSLTATGTSTSTILFQKSGVGANPLITAYSGGSGTPGSANQDGVWRLIGSDYVTVDGIDIVDLNTSNPETMEFGYGFFKMNGIDGCQNNIIRNCTITLNRINNATGTAPATDGSRGINMVNSTSNANTTALTVFSADGSNSNNKFYSNTIQNCNIGIALIGYADVSSFTFADTGNDIGGNGTTTGNTILNFGGGGTTNPSAAIRTLAQYNLNVAYNLINNNTGSGFNHAGVIRGIYLNTATSANATINSNTLTVSGGGTTSQVSVIENVSGSTSASNTISVINNLITNCNYSTSTSGSFYGIYNLASPAVLTIDNNTFLNNSTNASSGSTYLIYNTGAIGALGNITNNKLSFMYSGPAAYTGIMYSVYNTGTSLTASLTINNNNFSNTNHINAVGTGALYFIYNTGDMAALSMIANNWTGLSMNHSGAEYFMYNTSSTQSVLTVANNTITNHTRNAAAGSLYCYYGSATTPGTAIHTFSNNLFSNITATVSGTGTFYGIYNVEGNTSPYPRKLIFNNTISNVNMNGTGNFYGLYATDMGDGGTGSGSSLYNNVLTNLTFGDALYGVYIATPTSPLFAANVYSNTVSNLVSNGAASVVYGYDIGSNNAGINFYKNRVTGIFANGATGTAHGIYCIATSTSNVFNNLVGNINAPFSTGANRVNGIFVNAGSNYNIFYNTVNLNAVSSGTAFSSNAMYASTTPSVNLRNNIFINNSTPTGAGISAAYRRSSTTLTTYSPTSNNNLFYAGIPSANNVIFHNGSTAFQTLANFQTHVSARDVASVTQNVSFLTTNGASPNFLHISPNVSSLAESAGVNISGITDDYDNEVRQGNAGYLGPGSAPDIGADEFDQNITPCASASAGLVSVSSSTICSAQTVTLLSTGYTPGTGLTHQWKVSGAPGGPYSNVAGGSGANFIEYNSAPLTPGTYYFILETTCANVPVTASSAEVTVVVNSVPTASASVASSIVCLGQAVNLLGTTNVGTSYSWYGPAGFASSNQNPTITSISANGAGVYNLQVFANNCASPISTVAVHVSTVSVTLTATSGFLCTGNSATLTAVSVANTYSWNTGASFNSIIVTPTVNTIYNVVVTNTDNCSASRGLTISVVNPTITGNSVVACGSPATGTLSVNAFTPSMVDWYATPSSTLSLFNGTSYPITSPVTTTVYAEANSVSSGSLFTNVAGTSAFLGEMFDVVALNSIIVTGFDVHFTTAGTGTFEIWYRPGTHVGFSTSNTGWTLASSVVVNTNGAGNLTTIPSTLSILIPAGQTYGFYLASNTGPNVRYSTGTLLGAVYAQNSDLQILEGTTGNTYFNATTSPRGFNGTVKYAKPGCTSARIPITLTVSPNPILSVSASPATVCTGNTSTLTASGASTYSWINVGSGSSQTVAPLTFQTYSVTGTDGFGCSATTTLDVNLFALPNITIVQTSTSVCPSSVLSLTAMGANTYTWNNGTMAPVTTVTPASNSSYSVYGTNADGCVSSGTIAITTKSVPVISIAQSTAIVCAGEIVTFTATGAASYTWLPGNLLGTTFSATPLAPSVYNAIGLSVNGCTNIAFSSITANPCTATGENVNTGKTFQVFPNPSSGVVSLTFGTETKKEIRVMNYLGSLVHKFETSNTFEIIDLSTVPKGVYLITVKEGTISSNHKIIIQ